MRARTHTLLLVPQTARTIPRLQTFAHAGPSGSSLSSGPTPTPLPDSSAPARLPISQTLLWHHLLQDGLAHTPECKSQESDELVVYLSPRTDRELLEGTNPTLVPCPQELAEELLRKCLLNQNTHLLHYTGSRFPWCKTSETSQAAGFPTAVRSEAPRAVGFPTAIGSCRLHPPVHAGAGLGAIWVPQTLRVMKPHTVHTSSKLANTNENLRRGPFSQQVPGELLPGPSPLGLCFPRSAFRREPGCHRGQLRAALPGGPASAAPTTGQRPLGTGRPEVPRACMVSKEGQRAAWAQRSRVCT